MDIFDLAQQGMQIQEEEKREKMEAEALVAKSKAYRFDIIGAIKAAESKDYGWIYRTEENEKTFQPFMLNLWLGFIWDKKSNNQKRFTNNDKVYADAVMSLNRNLNTSVFSTSKELFWLLACMVQDEDDPLPYEIDYKKPTKNASEKYNPKVIAYMARELLSSKEKILDMINMDLITATMMNEIEKDLETIEEKKKK